MIAGAGCGRQSDQQNNAEVMSSTLSSSEPSTLSSSGTSSVSVSETGTSSASSSSAEVSAAETDSADYEVLTREVFAMDTYMTVSAYGADAEAALDEAENEIHRLDQLMAAESEDSEVARLNQNEGGELSEDAAYLIERSLEIHEKTDGAFEIAVYPIKKAWGFTDQNYRVPSDGEIAELLPLADSSLLKFEADEKKVEYLKEGVQIDLGGITKGYTSARLMDIFRDHSVKGMVNLGGNVQVCGGKPDGSRWRVAIQAPERTEEDTLPWLSKEASGSAVAAGIDYIGVLETDSQAVITSGGYERYFEQDGEYYHHIIDPKTGYPSDSDLISVTIVSEDGTLADGLSTSMFVLGLDRASEIWRSDKESFDMILMDTDGRLYATEGIRDQFISDLEIHWID